MGIEDKELDEFSQLAEAMDFDDASEFELEAAVEETPEEITTEALAEEAEETVKPVEGAEEVVTAESETAAPEAPAVEAVTEKPEVKPEAVAEATTAAETVAELDPGEREAQALQLQQFRSDAENLLAGQVYAMSDEQVAELEDDPKVAFPRYAARMHIEIMQAATNNVMRLLPQMMQEIKQQQSSSQQFEDQFHTAWPDLKGDTEAVMRVGAVYRQMNPQATPEDFIKDVGAQVMVALGKHQQAAPMQEAVADLSTVAPHRPAGRGAGSKLTPAPSTNEFSLMSEEEL